MSPIPPGWALRKTEAAARFLKGQFATELAIRRGRPPEVVQRDCSLSEALVQHLRYIAVDLISAINTPGERRHLHARLFLSIAL